LSDPSSSLLVVLEGDGSESARIPVSFSRKLASVLREQTLAIQATATPRQSGRSRTAGLQPQSMWILIALAVLLAISIPILIVGGSLIGRLSLGELISRGQEGLIVEPQSTPTPTPEGELGAYGAGFGWPDRFNNAELSREVESSKVLSPLSIVASVFTLGALLLPRTLRKDRRPVRGKSPVDQDARDADLPPWVSRNN